MTNPGKICRNRKKIAVRLGYLLLCAAAVGLILWGVIQMAINSPAPALIAMSGVAALSIVHHDIAIMVEVERRQNRH